LDHRNAILRKDLWRFVLNKRRSILSMTGAVVALVALSGSVMAADVSNGSFENAATGPATLTGGSTLIDGWTVTGTDVDYTDFWTAKDGAMSVDLNGFGQGGIKQTFATTVGSTYVVQFWLSGNPGNDVMFPNGTYSPDNKTLTVTATGGALKPYAFDTSVEKNTFEIMGWQDYGYSFKATSASTTVTFASTTEGSFGPAIDKVAVTEVVLTGANCKNDGYLNMSDASGNPFKNQGACVSFYAKSGATPIAR
jgi:choice-of-anchor C domain-containing protein